MQYSCTFTQLTFSLETEVGFFMDVEYIERLINAGDLDKADQYLQSFIEPKSSKESIFLFFEIRKQKYFEALGK
jgi:hypothetical protein